MKSFKSIFTFLLLIIISFLGLRIYGKFTVSKDLKNQKDIRLQKTSKVLNQCFDLENKSLRSINDSMKLIEYCLKEYGNEK